jgi:hypothetical protein
MNLRPSGFDRQEARDLAAGGFFELKAFKLIKQVKNPTESYPYGYYVLTVSGLKLFELIEKSAGCAPAQAAK